MKIPPPPTAPKIPMRPAANAIRMPAPASPKFTGFSGKISPGKVSITHHFDNGGNRAFNFHDPELAAQHVRRTLKREWEHPEKDTSKAINEDIDAPPVV